MIEWSPLKFVDLNNSLLELDEPLIHDYFYKGKRARTVVPVGYVTDLWSIPKCVRWLLDQDGEGNRYAVEHDWHGAAALISREDANAILRQNMVQDGRFPKWKINLICAGVAVWATMSPADSCREICRNRKLAGLFKGDYTIVDPLDVPRPLWLDGITKQELPNGL